MRHLFALLFIVGGFTSAAVAFDLHRDGTPTSDQIDFGSRYGNGTDVIMDHVFRRHVSGKETAAQELCERAYNSDDSWNAQRARDIAEHYGYNNRGDCDIARAVKWARVRFLHEDYRPPAKQQFRSFAHVDLAHGDVNRFVNAEARRFAEQFRAVYRCSQSLAAAGYAFHIGATFDDIYGQALAEHRDGFVRSSTAICGYGVNSIWLDDSFPSLTPLVASTPTASQPSTPLD